MSDMRIIENGLVPIYATDEADGIVNARELHEFLQSGWKFADWIQMRLDEYGFAEGQDFFRESGKSTGGRPPVEYFLVLDTAKEIAMVENNERGRQVRRYFIEIEKRAKALAAPRTAALSPLDALLQTVTILKEQERRLVEIEQQSAALMQQQTTLNHRVDSLDLTNIEGTRRQRLEKMVRLYAYRNGIKYPDGWKAFDIAYNLAFHANLTALRQNYAFKRSLKTPPSRPEYFELTNGLDDAIRIADKMLAKAVS